jgi:outer membrane protein assembly factor BamB
MNARFPSTLAPWLTLVALALGFASVRLVTRGAGSRRDTPDAAAQSATASDAQAEPPSVATAMPLLPGEAPASARATMQHGSPQRVHRARGRGPVKPRLVWQRDGLGALAAQVIPNAAEDVLIAVTLSGAVVWLDAQSGAVRRRVELEDRIYSTPFVADDGALFFGTDGKKFVSLAPDGAVRWKLEVDDEADTAVLPMPQGDLVFAAGAAVYGVTRTGTLRFRYRTKGKVYTAPALHPEGFVVVGAQDNHVYALSPEGALLWRVDLGADVDASPVIAQSGHIFVGTDAGEVVELSAKGQVLRRVALKGYVRGALSLSQRGLLTAGVYGPVARLVGLDVRDLSVRFEHVVPGTGAKDFGVHGGALEDAEGRLFFGAQDDRVYALGPTGTLLWTFETGGDVDAPLTLLADGRLIVASDDGTVYCIGDAPPP